jgi:hypothetical protein
MRMQKNYKKNPYKNPNFTGKKKMNVGLSVHTPVSLLKAWTAQPAA